MIRALTVVVVFFLLGWFAVGCTGDSASRSLKDRNIFQYNLLGEPTTLNAVTRTDAYSSTVANWVMDSLMTLDIDTLEWVPQLAKSYEIGEDGKTFTFELREGAKFHDGQPITPEDVKFSLEVYFIDAYGTFHRRPYYESIESIEIKEGNKIVFRTKDRYYKNFEVIATTHILPKHVYGDPEEGKKINQTMIGSGPYKIKEYERGQRLTLEKNQEWFGRDLEYFKDQYNFDEIVFRFPKEDAAGLQMLRRGLFDFMALKPEQYEEQTTGENWDGRINKYKVENRAVKGTSFIGWNFKKSIFQSRKTRLALYHLMNREQMNENFSFGLNLLATGPWYRQNPGADPDVKPVLFNVERAKELLKEDGWEDTDKDGFLDKEFEGARRKFEFTLIYPNKDSEKLWLLYQGDLREAGIDMKLQLLEWNSFIGRLDSMDFDACALAWSGALYYDPKQIWHSSSAVEGGSNFISYKNPKVDELIDRARLEMDADKRTQMLREVYRLIAEDVPYAFLFNPRYALFATSPRVKKTKDTFEYDIGVSYWSLDVPQVQAE